MSRRIHKNSFVEGTLVAYISIVVTKLLGALYSIPLYNIIGERGGVIYSCAYNIYALFLDVSTAGIPIAVSIVISRFFLEDMDKGVKPEDIAAAVRVVSVCLLVAPLLSIKRGYLQGHKYIAISSTSQVIEQIVRIAVVLTGVYVTIILLHMSHTIGVCVALSGAAIGALAALIFLQVRSRGVRATADPENAKEEVYHYCYYVCLFEHLFFSGYENALDGLTPPSLFRSRHTGNCKCCLNLGSQDWYDHNCTCDGSC